MPRPHTSPIHVTRPMPTPRHYTEICILLFEFLTNVWKYQFYFHYDFILILFLIPKKIFQYHFWDGKLLTKNKLT